jgi:predicted nucleic acid-binding protein
MKVFIDTNILLDIYHLSGADLEELRKLKKMVEKEKVNLLVSSQVVDEFWRNRERVISDALKSFKESKAVAKIPNIIRAYPEAKDLKASVNKTNEIVRALLEKTTEDIENDALKADAVVQELLSAVTIGEISDETIARAKRRCELGNPPGKKDSLGDGVNWEWLLEQEIDFWDDELVIISADGDYESELTKGKPREYLLREWSTRNTGCKLDN